MAQLLFKTANGVSLLQEDNGGLVSTNPCEIVAALKEDCKSSDFIDVWHATDMLSTITSCGGIRKIGTAKSCPRRPQHFYAYEVENPVNGGGLFCGFASANVIDRRIDGLKAVLKVW